MLCVSVVWQLTIYRQIHFRMLFLWIPSVFRNCEKSLALEVDGDFLKETQSVAKWLTSLRGARNKVRYDTQTSTVGVSPIGG